MAFIFALTPALVLFFVFSSFSGPILIASLILLFLVGIILCAVYLSNIMRRFHDRGKSGWWTLIIFVPFIGFLWMIVECGFLKGTTGPNQYGPDPLATDVPSPNSVQSVSVTSNVLVENQSTVTASPVAQQEQMSAN
jgi:uncharacterized membrane protein YhaH (DUF805 family)